MSYGCKNNPKANNQKKNKTICRGRFYSESAVEMSNRHIKVPKIVPGLLFLESDIRVWVISIYGKKYFSTLPTLPILKRR